MNSGVNCGAHSLLMDILHSSFISVDTTTTRTVSAGVLLLHVQFIDLCLGSFAQCFAFLLSVL